MPGDALLVQQRLSLCSFTTLTLKEQRRFASSLVFSPLGFVFAKRQLAVSQLVNWFGSYVAPGLLSTPGKVCTWSREPLGVPGQCPKFGGRGFLRITTARGAARCDGAGAVHLFIYPRS